MDPHHFCSLDPDPHFLCGSGSRGVKISLIMEKSASEIKKTDFCKGFKILLQGL
jgi:hypothetical protein